MATSEFVALACSVGPGRQQIQSRVKTTSGQAGVSGADLKRVVITLPGIEKQLAAVSAIGERLSSIGMLASSIDSAKLRARQLKRSLLGAAFTGRLTRAKSTS
jgi:type I restriction enzyme S subunit